MSYTKHNWSDGDKLYASQLNSIETEIVALENSLSSLSTGANLGSTAYQKPSSGIPASDLNSEITESLSAIKSDLKEIEQKGISTDGASVGQVPTAYEAEDGSMSWQWRDQQGGGSSITVDTELSETSENPVQNKVIYAALNGLSDLNALIGGDTE